jgi:hypothetical protein
MQKNKSIYVDILAWMMIVLSACALISSIVYVLINFSFSDGAHMNKGADGDIDSFYLWIFFAVICLFISIAFLKRKEWGRIGLIMLFGFIIIFNIVGLIVLWQSINSWSFEFSLQIPLLFFEPIIGLGIFIISMIISFLVIALSVLLGWLIIMLSSKKIAAEFKVNKLEKVQPTKNDLTVKDNEENQNQDEDNQIWLYNGVG